MRRPSPLAITGSVYSLPGASRREPLRFRHTERERATPRAARSPTVQVTKDPGESLSPSFAFRKAGRTGMLKKITSITDGALLLLWISVVPMGPFWLPNALGMTYLTIGLSPANSGAPQSAFPSRVATQIVRIERQPDQSAPTMAPDYLRLEK